MTVLESTAGDFPNLDPATNTSDYADVPQMDAIYGDLFEFGAGGKVVPDLASGYKFTNGDKTLAISLRTGVKFSDGTPFNAAAVAFNIKRDLSPKYACACAPDFPVKSITTPNSSTVDLNLTRIFTPIVNGFYGAAPNWIVSPTALKKMGQKKFSITPVGAGPFTVVTDQPNAQLVLKKNPLYWQKGHPLVDNLTFTAIQSDQSAYEALVAGQAQTYQAASTISLLATAKKNGITVTPNPESLAPDGLQFNVGIPPFNNIKAREAVYYATNIPPINKSINGGLGIPTQTPTIPGGFFSEPKIAGYRTYNLAKAKALVKQLGGLSFKLMSGNAGSQLTISTALKAEYAQAGITVTIQPETLSGEVALFQNRSWQAAFASLGGYQPALGMSTRYASNGVFSGIKDPKLDGFMAKLTGTASKAGQAKVAKELFAYINAQAYTPFLWVGSNYTLTVKGLKAPGLTDTSFEAVPWQDMTLSGS